MGLQNPEVWTRSAHGKVFKNRQNHQIWVGSETPPCWGVRPHLRVHIRLPAILLHIRCQNSLPGINILASHAKKFMGIGVTLKGILHYLQRKESLGALGWRMYHLLFSIFGTQTRRLGSTTFRTLKRFFWSQKIVLGKKKKKSVLRKYFFFLTFLRPKNGKNRWKSSKIMQNHAKSIENPSKMVKNGSKMVKKKNICAVPIFFFLP